MSHKNYSYFMTVHIFLKSNAIVFVCKNGTVFKTFIFHEIHSLLMVFDEWKFSSYYLNLFSAVAWCWSLSSYSSYCGWASHGLRQGLLNMERRSVRYIRASLYGRKSTDRTEHGNDDIFFCFFGHCFRQFRGLESQEMKYFLKIY